MQTDPNKAVSSSEQEYVERVAVRRFNWHPPSRRTALLTRGADPATESGVEFGALNNPIVRPMDGDISFVDYATTESLRAYPHDARIDKAGIVDVNYIWAASGPL